MTTTMAVTLADVKTC